MNLSCLQVRDELQGQKLCGLINNAGHCQPAPFLHQPVSDFKHTIDANLTGVFIVSQVSCFAYDSY